MNTFDEQELLNKGTPEKQVTLIKNIIKTLSPLENIVLTSIEFPEQPFGKAYLYTSSPHAMISIVNTTYIDCRLPFPTRQGTIGTNKQIQETYIKAIFTADFDTYNSLGYLLDLIMPTLPQKPFAHGIITKEKQTGEKQLTNKALSFSLQQREPFIIFYFSAEAIGDTCIEIHNTL